MSIENQPSVQEQIQALTAQVRELEKMAFPLYRGRIIQFFQGNKADMPTLKIGQPAFCTDVNEFYIGGADGKGNQKVLMEHEQGSVVIEDGSISFVKLDTALQNEINKFITLNDIPIVSTTANGLMTVAQNQKLNDIQAGATKTTIINNLTSLDPLSAVSAYQAKLLKDQIDTIEGSIGTKYTLPSATTSTLGGIIVGANLSVTATGVLSVSQASTTNVGVVKLNSSLTSTSITEAATPSAIKQLKDKIDVIEAGSSSIDVVDSLTSTSSTSALSANQGKILNDTKANKTLASATLDGLMSASDKTKINGIANGATNTPIVNNLTSTSSTSALSANQGKTLKDLIDGIVPTPIVNNLTSTSATSALSASQGKTLKDLIDGIVPTPPFDPSTIPDATSTQRGMMTSAQVVKLDDLDKFKTETLDENQDLSQYATDPDASFIYRKVTFKRKNGTNYMISQLSTPNAQGNYQKDVWTYYAANGTTVLKTKTWTLTYDAYGNITSKVVS